MATRQSYDSPEARDLIRKRWNHLLREARSELDDFTIAAGLGVLIGEWLAGLPENLANNWNPRARSERRSVPAS